MSEEDTKNETTEKSELTQILTNMSDVDGRIGDLAKLAVQKVGELEREIEELQAENENLWFMLDEMKQAHQWTREHTQELQRSINEHMAMYKMMQKNRGDA